jgi:putative transposase
MKKNEHGMSPEAFESLFGDLKDCKDWNQIDERFRTLKAAVVEKALAGELTYHLGYDKGAGGDKETDNRRNGASAKTLKTENGELTINVPRDRDGSFDPILVRNHQRRLPGFDDKVLALYARGLSMKEIQGYLHEIYATDVSAELISEITDEVMAELTVWQNRPLESHYPILYLDALRVKIRDNGRIENKAVFIVIGVDMEGRKDILGLWIAKSEGSKFWLSIMTDLKNRGVEDIYITCCDGLTGLPDAISAAFPRTTVQLCIVHIIRNSLKYVAWKDYKFVTKDLKKIYAASTEAVARAELDVFKTAWHGKYPAIASIWERNWENIVPFLAFPSEIRRIIYTTNTIEALNRQIRKIIKTKGSFPSDDAALKLIFLALQNATINFIMPAREWKQALAQFAILFHDRLPA